jgi:uncharacterized protein (DUF58 family)
MSPTGFAAALVALGALAAFAVPAAPLLIALAALIGAFAVDASRIRKPPSVRREVPDLLSLGVPEPFRVEVDAPAGAGVKIRQARPGDVELDPQEAVGRVLEGTITARRRGRHALPAVAVRLRGPLGLAAWIHDCMGPAEIHVYPDMPAAYRAAAQARHTRYRDPGSRGRGPLGLGTEFESVRDYSPDDDIRQVNWRATARLGRPMSNDYRLEQDRDVIAVIDAGRLMRAPLEDRSRLDAALDAVAALASVADDGGDRFGALAFDGEPRLWMPPSRLGARPVLTALYDLEPSGSDSDYARAFQSLTAAKRALVFLFTDLIEEVAARPLVSAMPVLARRHAVTLVSVRDEDLESAVTGERGEATQVIDALRASVALEVLDARTRAAAFTRAAGAEIVEAPPGELAGAVVTSYLRAKTRARA